jgi:hypothetical protein
LYQILPRSNYSLNRGLRRHVSLAPIILRQE